MPTNLGMVSLLIGFVDYMASVGNPGGHPVGDVPGAKRLNLTFKQHMQMQLLLFLLMLFTIGSFIIVIYLTKSLINGNLMKGSRSFVKRSIKKLKKFYPSNKRMVKLIGCGGHQVSFKIDDLDDKSNFQKLVECLLQNKNKVSLILIVGGIIYLYFAKLQFLKVNIHNN